MENGMKKPMTSEYISYGDDHDDVHVDDDDDGQKTFPLSTPCGGAAFLSPGPCAPCRR